MFFLPALPYAQSIFNAGEIKKLNAQITKTKDAAEKLRLKDLVDYMRKVEMAVVISEDADEEAKFAAEGLSIKPHRNRMNKIDENGFDEDLDNVIPFN